MMVLTIKVILYKNVRKYIETKPQYKSKYYQGGYPTDHYGVCSDVVAFGLLNTGYDLQILVDQDIEKILKVIKLNIQIKILIFDE